MASIKKNDKFTKVNASRAKLSNCENITESSKLASFIGAKSKENKTVAKEQGMSYLSKAKSKLQPQVFDFSSGSDDEVKDPPKTPLKEQNRNPLKGSLPQEIYADVLSKHMIKDNNAKITPRSTKTKSEDQNLEWESLLESSHHSKHLTASGKKKLFSGRNNDVHFHSTPKESKNRLKLKNSHLCKKLSQKLECEEFTNVPNMAIIDDEESVDFNQHSQTASEDEFIEVQDSSAQTSFQTRILQDISQCQKDIHKNCPKVADLSTETSYTQGFNGKQDKLHLIAESHRFNQSTNSTEDNAARVSSKDKPYISNEIKSSPSVYHSQLSLDFDDKLATKSQESAHSSQSFVDVQDASVQVEPMLSAEQNHVSLAGSVSDDRSPSTGTPPDNSLYTVVEQSNEENCAPNSLNGKTCEESSFRENSKSQCDEDNNNSASTSSGSSVFLSALEAVPARPNSSNRNQMFSDTNDVTGEAGSPHDLLGGITETGSNSHYDEALACQDVPGVLAEDTDTSDSECASREETNDQPSWRIQASFSDGSVSDEDLDLRKDRVKVLTTETESSFCKTKTFAKTNTNEVSDTCENDGDLKEKNGNGCIEPFFEGNGAFEYEKSTSITEISDMLKSATISRRRRCSDSSDEDDAFEKFLTKMKAPNQPEEDEKAELERSMSDFIANDDENLSDESSCPSGESEDEMFHVRVDNIVDSKRRPRKKTSSYFEGESSEGSGEDVKSKPILELSSDDDDLLDDSIKDVRKLPQPIHKSSSVNSLGNETPQTPELKLNSKADLDHDEAQDFKTPFKTPVRPAKVLKAWERPFETPAADHTRNYSELKDQKICPMTVSRLHHLGRRSNIGLDDDAVFLKSLSEDYPDYKRHPETSRYIKNFKDRKADLTKRLFAIYNKSIFKEQLPADLDIEWSALYRKTAGTFCYRSSTREAKITLSVKVCDRAERVRDTLAHELCHAAVRLINGVKESHGPVWRSWAQKVNRAFPFMPVIARCHDYVIATKYTYQCTKCNYRIGRHSKSLDTEKKVCGHCLGKFEVYLTRDLNSVSSEGERTPATPRTPRTPNKFALFVKESYAEVKKQDNNLKHADVMKILSRQFSEKTKISE